MQILDLQGGARVRSRAAWIVVCAYLAGCSSGGAPPSVAESRVAKQAAPAEARIDSLTETDLTSDPELTLDPELTSDPEFATAEQGPPKAAFEPDWSASVFATTTNEEGQVLMNLFAVIENDWLFVVVDQLPRRAELRYNLFIDSDNRPATGHKSGFWSTSSGAEMLVSGNVLLRYASERGDGTDWGTWTDVAGVSVESVRSTFGDEGVARYFQIPLSALEATASAGLGLGFQSVYSDEPDYDLAPASPAFLRIAPEGSAPYDVANCRYGEAPPRPTEWATPTCPEGYPTAFPEPAAKAFDVGRGVVIPAYIDPTSADAGEEWKKVLDGIETVRASASSATVHDYWIAINGPKPGGPPVDFADWSPYTEHWERLTEQSDIKTFGYVYSCVGKCETKGELRPLQKVMDDITRWVCGYPDLDGIWIDEFYPQYELTTSTSGSIVPNVEEDGALTPYDRCFVRWDGSNNDSYHVRPDGGYFDQLTAWIRATYPHLKIIGNAGGNLISTLPNYAGLVDVFVGYENSYNRAFNVDGTLPSKVLVASPPGKAGQLAIFHETSLDEMPIVLDAAWMLGYTHVYATHGAFAGGAGNPWGGVASYLSDELLFVFPPPAE